MSRLHLKLAIASPSLRHDAAGKKVELSATAVDCRSPILPSNVLPAVNDGGARYRQNNAINQKRPHYIRKTRARYLVKC
jgi:hypothetical protein